MLISGFKGLTNKYIFYRALNAQRMTFKSVVLHTVYMPSPEKFYVTKHHLNKYKTKQTKQKKKKKKKTMSPNSNSR